MASSANHIILCNTTTITTKPMQLQRCRTTHTSTTTAGDDKPTKSSRRWAIMLTVLATSSTTPLLRTPPSRAQSWGTHSFMKEKYFMPDISPEDSVARIRQTTEGMHEMRHMLDTMSWRYVMFYIRLKAAYLETDLKNAMTVVPKPKHQSYIKIANEVVDSMTDLDRFVRTPKVYESYLYYEKTLKSLDALVAFLA
ncbi:photosynthetic NDH subunit of lumenal location 2, chloroplastic [Dioscorea cayenensis subsp. rotundata]|uniref:Photosynthetic NDH subunit of lumenal location 2, chloroplastic n=1 Tax=Dioscorea cayennensis subsp. rotundata TaxID=55577 RepID=A0AB40AKI4_DIOCR|nr:photosynthetic NDH subunit of lumenal location 2, chloroplastic [Dioscorea cayenensis subsp. rotundata]